MPAPAPITTIAISVTSSPLRRQMGGLRVTITGRGAGATDLPPRVFPLPFIAIGSNGPPGAPGELLLQHEPGDEDRKLVEDYQGNHHDRHRVPVLRGGDDRAEHGDPDQGSPAVLP